VALFTDLTADSGFYNEGVLRRAYDIAATVVHVFKKGRRMKDKATPDKKRSDTPSKQLPEISNVLHKSV
jgi:hypothetical protein